MEAKEKQIRDMLALRIPGAGRKNYSVKAGAGGGKTTLLSQRICNQLLLGTPIEEFVIITYTNAAAAELREKITVLLQQLIRRGISDEAQRKNAVNALNSIELMQISTIHAFLFKVLRENAFEAGVVTDAEMLEDSEDKARQTKFFDAWYHMHFKEIKGFGTDWVFTGKTNGRPVDYKREVLENMFHDLANVREEIIYDTADRSADFEKEAEEYVKQWLPALRNFKSEFLKKQPRKEDKAQTPYKWLNASKEIIDAIAFVEGRTEYGIEEACELSKALFGIKDIVDNDGKFYPRDKVSNLVLDPVIPAYPSAELEWNFSKFYEEFASNAAKVAKVAEYVCKMQKEYQTQMDAETRVLSNDDILYRAEKLLTGHPEVLDKLKKRYTKIYVDEFQDTTGLQTGIVKLLSGVCKSGGTEAAFAEDKLLVVGDPKQSIYRFTGAEKAVYDTMDRMMRELPDAVAESVSLDTNFRSNRKVVDWVNQSFGRLMAGEYSPMDTDWVVTEQNALHGVYRYVPENNDSLRGSDTYGGVQDVEAVCDLVKRLVGNTHCFIEKSLRMPDGSFGTPKLASIQYSDIMIICKNTTHMADYVEKFAAEGIPVNVQGKFKVTDDVVLRNFVLLAEYFAGYKNKKRRITAAQILLGEDVTGAEACSLKEAEEELRTLRMYFKENQMDCGAILQYLLAHEELYLPKGEVQETERVRSYRIRLHQMVEACLGNNKGDLADVVCLLREYLNNDVRREIPLESNENAIRLMNAHQSKGLTGQIVILADRSSEEKCRYSGFKKEGKYYPAVSFKKTAFGAPKIMPAYGYDRKVLAQVYREETEESVRLQYVAATRAAHALIIMPVVDRSKAVWFTAPEYGYDRLPDVNEWLKDRETDTAVYDVVTTDAGAKHEIVTLAELAKNLEGADRKQQSAAQLTSITPSGLEPKGVTGYSHGEEGYVKEERPSANVFGLVMHRVYELAAVRYERLRSLSDEEREPVIERMIRQAILEQEEELRREDKPEDFLAYLKPLMLKYLRTVLEPIFESAEVLYPEFAFNFYVPENEKAQFMTEFGRFLEKEKTEIEAGSGAIWINGQADLVVKQKDGTVKVYDYKSDAMNGKPMDLFEKALAEKYEGQLALYRYAIGKAFGAETVETELIHLYR